MGTLVKSLLSLSTQPVMDLLKCFLEEMETPDNSSQSDNQKLI